MARLKYNGLRAFLGASLTNVATTITFSAGLKHSNGTNVPTITGSDFIPLTLLDPTTGLILEVVYLTAYTAAATTGTISRGQEGTSGVAHSNGDPVVHDAMAADFGIVTAYVPAWTAVTTNPVLNNGTATGHYILIGPMCFFRAQVTSGSTTTYGSGQYSFTVPVAATQDVPIWGEVRNGGNPWQVVGTLAAGTNTVPPKAQVAAAGGVTGNVTQTVPAAWATGAIFRFSGCYLWA